MKKFSTLLFLLLSNFCFSQNLVPNPSFEDTISCPIGLGDINDAVSWSSYSETPDYFNKCNTSTVGTSYVGVPNNFFGYQNAKTGGAYAGIYSFTKNAFNYREIIGTQLSQQSIIGQKYFIAFYVSRGFNATDRVNAATNKLGARFSTISYSYSNPIPIDNIAQVYTDSVITDTLNWVKVSGSFISDSAYNYISIGNFFTDSATTHVNLDSTAEFAYYYIDDVRVSTDSDYVNAINKYNSPDLISVFPNPARDWISIRGNDIQSLVLYDVLGRIVYINSAVISPAIMNTSSFQKGIYFIEAKTKNTINTQSILLE